MLEPHDIARLLVPYTQDALILPELSSKLAAYLELILKWNARTNLTAIRDPQSIVRRHFGESLFVGLHLPVTGESLLDFGSGGGFPGLPIQLLRPELKVTLAESQGKKASFLREAVRILQLPTEVWANRVEAMPPERQFDVVTMRAVDKMGQAVATARLRVRAGGTLAVLTADDVNGIPVPGSSFSLLQLTQL